MILLTIVSEENESPTYEVKIQEKATRWIRHVRLATARQAGPGTRR